jgi:hypothetical protein
LRTTTLNGKASLFLSFLTKEVISNDIEIFERRNLINSLSGGQLVHRRLHQGLHSCHGLNSVW